MIPGLEQRLMNGDGEDMGSIAEMVRPVNRILLPLIKAFVLRYKKGCQAPALMTRKVSRALYWIG
jgi:hypothetical protein